ncbi:MAG: hypothetical protein N2C13_00845 [Chloroflexota bacterium]
MLSNLISNQNFIGWTIITSGIWWILQMIFVTLLYTLKASPFGGMSDFSNILTMLLLLPFSFVLFKSNQESAPTLSLIALMLGIAGILSISIASAMLIAKRIQFLQSLIPVFGGYVAFGISLLINLWIAKNNASMPPSVLNWGLMVGLGLVSIAGLLTVDLAQLFSFNMDGLWSNPFIYPAFILTPFFFLGYPFWAFMVGRRMLAGNLLFN